MFRRLVLAADLVALLVDSGVSQEPEIDLYPQALAPID
jgi:hypothetical protein